ncbi:MAG: tetratricopeptide repeat protein [Elusimicrobia bacterium]|nr:tetratricopeptide repeat protein [Elusimicrobiota bacterium]
MKFILLLLLLAVTFAVAASPNADELAEARQEMQKIAANLEENIKLEPEKVDLYVQLGFIYSKLDKIDEAQKAFENAVRLDPKNAKSHFMLGLIYEKKGLKNKAIAAWQSCLDNAVKKKTRKIAIKHLHFLRAQ